MLLLLLLLFFAFRCIDPEGHCYYYYCYWYCYKLVHDATTTAKDNGVVGTSVRLKDFRIPKSSILESASEGEFRVVQAPPVESEEDGMTNDVDWKQASSAANGVTAAAVIC